MADAPEAGTGRLGRGGDADRILDTVGRLTAGEKRRLVRGAYPTWGETTPGASGYLPPIERLDIPPVRFENGPLGVQSGDGTAFPAAIALGATFDVELAARFGEAIGAEARDRGVDVLLAPGCNLVRVPHCGRNFEYYGEDPYQSARIAAAAVRGIQSRGVVATPKHYVANNQEHERVEASAEVDERPLRELYLRAFEAAVVEGDAGAVMAAYNRVNGTRATEHERLLTDVLKEEFGFEGPVVSDWWAIRDGPAAARSGLDLEMPGTDLLDHKSMSHERLRYLRAVDARWPERLPGPEALAAWLFERYGDPGGMPRPHSSSFARTLHAEDGRGALPDDRLDDMVRRVLTLHERVGALDGRRTSVDVDPSSHRDLAERIATDGSVLLKNDAETLPLDPAATIALIGPHVDEAKTGGGGSSEVATSTVVSPLDGIRDRSAGDVLVERGHPPIEGSVVAELDLVSTIRSKWVAASDVDDARRAAGDADVAVLVVQDDAAEGRDKASLSLPGRQDALISAVASVAERTVVVLQTAGPVEMPWVGAVDAVLETWYPGQEAGRAIAALLYGDRDPGGRLPVTFARSERDYPTRSRARYPGIESVHGYPRATYDEGLFVGYRHFDERGVEPLFPFGHGLSYAEFSYGAVEISVDDADASVSVTVSNTCDCRGRDVVQVYARRTSPGVPRPPRELVGFRPVALDVDETRHVQVPLDERAFAHYDEREAEWTVEPGEWVLEVGRSSRDVRTTGTITIPE